MRVTRASNLNDPTFDITNENKKIDTSGPNKFRSGKISSRCVTQSRADPETFRAGGSPDGCVSSCFSLGAGGISYGDSARSTPLGTRPMSEGPGTGSSSAQVAGMKSIGGTNLLTRAITCQMDPHSLKMAC
jgi:hypothetical protein